MTRLSRRSVLRALGALAGTAGLTTDASADTGEDAPPSKHHQLVYWTPPNGEGPADVPTRALVKVLAFSDVTKVTVGTPVANGDIPIWVHVGAETTRDDAGAFAHGVEQLLDHYADRAAPEQE